MVLETKLDCSFWKVHVIIAGYASQCRYESYSNEGGLLLFAKEDIASHYRKTLKGFYAKSDLHKQNLNPHKSNIANHIDILGKTLGIQISKYDNFLIVGDFI